MDSLRHRNIHHSMLCLMARIISPRNSHFDGYLMGSECWNTLMVLCSCMWLHLFLILLVLSLMMLKALSRFLTLLDAYDKKLEK